MFKKAFLLILILSLLIPCIPMQANASTEKAPISSDELMSIIEAQFDAVVASAQAEGASEAITQLVEHSIRSGSTLNMDMDDDFTKALLNTEPKSAIV